MTEKTTTKAPSGASQHIAKAQDLLIEVLRACRRLEARDRETFFAPLAGIQTDVGRALGRLDYASEVLEEDA